MKHFRPVATPVAIVSTSFRGDRAPQYTVLVDDEYYVVNRFLLSCLEAGETPASLELEPEPDEDSPEFVGWDRAASAGDSLHQQRREGV